MRKKDVGQVIWGLLIFAGGYGCGLFAGVGSLELAATPVGRGDVNASAADFVFQRGQGSSPPVRHPAPALDKWALFSQGVPLQLIADPGLVAAAVEQFGDEELLALITAYTQLAPHDLPVDVPIADIAVRLAEIYYGDSYERIDNPLDNSVLTTDLEFGLTTLKGNQVTDSLDVFTGTDRRIYASFAMVDYAESQVVVKWSRTDSPELLVYNKYPIMADADNNYVWLEQPQGWDAGEYQVEIYSLADNLSLLARGNYDVD